MVIDGYGVKGIADALTADKVLIPSAYAKLHNPENDHSKGFHDTCLWSSTAVGYILEKPEYMGHTVLGKAICGNYKTKKRRKAKPEELMIFRDTHEAIVDEETWQLAHRLKKTIRKPSYPDRPANSLTGLLCCADCGHKLTHHQPSPGKKKVYDADDYYICGNYRQLTRDCTIHYIKTSTIEKLILTAIREAAELKEGITAQARGYYVRRGRNKSAKGIGGEEPGTGAKQAAYAPGERATKGCKGNLKTVACSPFQKQGRIDNDKNRPSVMYQSTHNRV